ncbi:hypothetical protein PGT21_027576 [Puccinia graminis f. sp. tritici]|uniref:Uncharacterized protein n=1 Tax=Puccinia graminis f. sp. tritici TaxID=56615 RepID=A0A5B0MXF7_PUCGR|nr:hypothetical protein PGT21_027576 [Puccinia graminis f. sp. tritici]KAA1131164.1 hypothetical protein PGTUg99_019896 [Puccinia graminis f. sp. tritici]
MAMDSTTPTSNGLALLGGIHPNGNDQSLCKNAATPKQYLAKADAHRNGNPKEDSTRGEIPNGKVSKDDVSEQNGAKENGLGKEKNLRRKRRRRNRRRKRRKKTKRLSRQKPCELTQSSASLNNSKPFKNRPT